jgi:short-subunit dehydrogenase
MKKVALITGASAGMGKETAKLLAQNGYTVYGAARRIDKMEDLKAFGIKPVAMDITKDESIVACMQLILAETDGHIDVLVNSAGFGSHGAIEEVPIQDAKYQLEVNVFGAMRLTQLILPYMRENKFGKIVNISSVGGKLAGPLGGWYHASKFALEGLSDSLRNEVKPFGIDVIVIEPGAVKSEWSSIACDNLMNISGNGAYKAMATKFANVIKNSDVQSSDPIVIAELIKKAIEAKNPKARYVKGHLAQPILFTKKVTSDKIMDKILASQFK